MRRLSACMWLCVALLWPWCVHSQPALSRPDEDEDAQSALLAARLLDALLRSERHAGTPAALRRSPPPRPSFLLPKRAQQGGSRFNLSLDVPTSILSVLIDLAKNQDQRTKAAANAELMARIGKRK